MNERKAFTLIELLVVIAILSLLLTLIVPTLQNATEAARITQCIAQINTIGNGIVQYTGENNGALLLPAPDPTRINTIDAVGQKGGLGYLYPRYVDNYHAFYCPTSRESYRSWNRSDYWRPNTFDAPGSNGQQSYRYLANRESYNYGSPGSFLGSYDKEKVAGKRLDDPNQVLMTEAFERYNADYYKANHTYTFDAVTRYAPYGAGFLFADGHVKFGKTGREDYYAAGISSGWLGDVYIRHRRAIYTKP